MLVPGWTPFCLQNCLYSSWHRFNKVLETFLRDCGSYWHDRITQLLQNCWLHIHDANLPFHHIPKELYWLRSGDYGGHLSKVNSLACTRNQSEDDLSFVTWCIILLEVAIRRWVHCSHKGMDMVSNNTQVGCGHFNGAQLDLRGPKCAKKISPTPLHHHQQPEPVETRAGWIHAFMFFTAKFWPYHLNVAAEIETHQTRQRFSNLLLSNFGEPVRIVASVSCS